MTKAKAKAAPKKPAAKRTPVHHDWVKVRAQWEGTNISFSALATQLGGISKQALTKRAEREGWKRLEDKSPSFKKKVAAKADETAKSAAHGEVMPPEETAPPGETSPLAIDVGVVARAQIIDRHRREWQIPRNRLYAAAQDTTDKAFGKMKEAKIMSEALAIMHAGERKAWGLDGETVLTVKHVIPPSRRDRYD